MRLHLAMVALVAASGCGRLGFGVESDGGLNGDAMPNGTDGGTAPTAPLVVERVTPMISTGTISPNSVIALRATSNEGGFAAAIRFSQSITVDGETFLGLANQSTLLLRFDANREVIAERVLQARNEAIGTGFCEVRALAERTDGSLVGAAIVLGGGGDNGPCDGETGTSQEAGLISIGPGDLDPSLLLFEGTNANAQAQVLATYSDGDIGVMGLYGANLNVLGVEMPESAGEGLFVTRVAQANAVWANGTVTVPNTGVILPGDFDVGAQDLGCAVAWLGSGPSVLLGGSTYTSNGSLDVLVIGLDAAGGLRFATQIGSTVEDIARTVIATDDGGCLVGGKVGGAADFGAAGIKDTAGSADGFIAKIDSDGVITDATLFGGVGSDQVVILRERDDGVVVAGFQFSESVSIAGGTATSAGEQDIALFSVAGDTTATSLLATLGGVGFETLMDLAFAPSGEAAILVRYEGTTSIGDHNETSSDSDGLIAWLRSRTQ